MFADNEGAHPSRDTCKVLNSSRILVFTHKYWTRLIIFARDSLFCLFVNGKDRKLVRISISSQNYKTFFFITDEDSR